MRDKQPIKTIEFREGMEDGYATYSIAGEFTGYFRKGEKLPRNNKRPAMYLKKGWVEVEKGDKIVLNSENEPLFILKKKEAQKENQEEKETRENPDDLTKLDPFLMMQLMEVDTPSLKAICKFIISVLEARGENI